jgi:hypothetical protein
MRNPVGGGRGEKEERGKMYLWRKVTTSNRRYGEKEDIGLLAYGLPMGLQADGMELRLAGRGRDSEVHHLRGASHE